MRDMHRAWFLQTCHLAYVVEITAANDRHRNRLFLGAHLTNERFQEVNVRVLDPEVGLVIVLSRQTTERGAVLGEVGIVAALVLQGSNGLNSVSKRSHHHEVTKRSFWEGLVQTNYAKPFPNSVILNMLP